MNIQCLKADLVQSVNTVLKAVPTRTTLPILECILLECTNGENLTLTTNDMELGIETTINADIKEPGNVAIDAKIFSDIVKKLPDEMVSIRTDINYQTTIECGKAKFNIAAKSGEEFVRLPMIEKNQSIEISQFTLKETIRQTIFGVSDNENNKLMTGELFEITDNQLQVVALDGHRISIRKVTLDKSYEPIKVIVPGKTLTEISKVLSGEITDTVIIYFTDKHILFEFDNTRVVSRLIEGEYYKISQMLSNDYETKIAINKKELYSCIERAALLIKEGDKRPIIIYVNEGQLELRVESQLGSMKEEIDIQQEGKNIIIGFNPRFLLEALRVIDDEDINIYLVNPKAPCYIKHEEEKYTYLILPVNINVTQS